MAGEGHPPFLLQQQMIILSGVLLLPGRHFRSTSSIQLIFQDTPDHPYSRAGDEPWVFGDYLVFA